MGGGISQETQAAAKAKKAKNSIFPQGLKKELTLPNTWHYPSWKDFGLLTSKTIKEFVYVVLIDDICGKLLQQQWETNTM